MDLKKYLLSVFAITFLSVLLFALPLVLLSPEIAKGYVCGIPPQLFVSLSWVLGYEYARKYCPEKTMLFTFGLIPIRFLVEVAWFYLLYLADSSIIGVAVGSAIIHFALFTIPQILCINYTCSK